MLRRTGMAESSLVCSGIDWELEAWEVVLVAVGGDEGFVGGFSFGIGRCFDHTGRPRIL